MDYRKEIIEGILIGLLIVGIAIILFIIKGQLVNDYPENRNTLKVEDLQTGDILSVSYSNQLGIFISFWSNSTWSHPAMIYRRSSTEIFVIEACRYSQEWRGVIVIPLDKWLELNKKHIVSLTKISGPRIHNDVVESALSKIVTYRLQSFNVGWTRFLRKKQPYQDPEGERFVCYEILTTFLQELGVVRKLYSHSAYWPGDFCWGKLDLEDTYKYQDPVLLV